MDSLGFNELKNDEKLCIFRIFESSYKEMEVFKKYHFINPSARVSRTRDVVVNQDLFWLFNEHSVAFRVQKQPKTIELSYSI